MAKFLAGIVLGGVLAGGTAYSYSNPQSPVAIGTVLLAVFTVICVAVAAFAEENK